MSRFRRVMIVAVALLLALGVGDAGLYGAGKGKPPKPPKKAAPKVQHHNAKPAPKPKNPKTAKAKGTPKTTVVKNKGPKPVRKPMYVRREVVRPTVHEYARFNARRELSFDKHWWYRFVLYPRTVAVASAGFVDYSNVVVPTNITVTPPVIPPGKGLPLSPAGKRLAGRLDGMGVETHWLSGQQVDWKTGNTESSAGPPSNAGAFVAAVCARLKIPMADPANPDNLLSISQYDWLLIDGKAQGWVAVGPTEAQILANQGWLVIAAWKGPVGGDLSLAGHTAIVRPSDTAATLVAERGPRIIMAGVKNQNDVALKDGFPTKAHKDVLFLACKPH